MNLTKATSRAAEIRASLESAERDARDARERLGIAIADADERAAKAAREDVAQAERLADELRAALPIAESRARQAAEAEREAQRRAAEREANKNRKARIAAAKRVDAALAALGKAYTEYLSTAPGGRSEDRNRLARRGRAAIASAMILACPELADALEVRRIPSMHRHSLTRAVEGTIGEFAVEAEPEAEPA
ncbi:MAG TPA: hypothetical protein VJP77_09795 [Planctomycetota bacterium]|nr:hypothetical protein [Planctomycetota bacterium]